MANESDYPAKYQLEDGSGFYLLETGTDYYLKETQNYPEIVISDGAFCYFRLDEASGNFNDMVGGRVGTPSGAAMTYAQSGALVGDTDTSVNLTNNNQVITVPGEAAFSAAAHSNNLTVEVWANLSGMPTNNTGQAPFVRLNGNTDWVFQVVLTNATTIRVNLTVKDSAAGTLSNNDNSLSDDPTAWHLFTFVIDSVSASTTMYVDGATFNSNDPFAGTGIPKTWTTGNLEIGGTTTSAILGRLDEFAMYPTALTADQVARHYRCGIQFLPNETGFATPSQYAQLLAH